MSRSGQCSVVCAVILAAGSVDGQQPPGPTGGVVGFMAPVLPDSLLQHSKEIYILYGCACCHGVDLKVVNGEAADLLHSGSIAADENGNVIGRILRSGIPQTAKLSPMPQYSDLSDQEIADITTWIHYARRQGRYKELMETNLPPGSAAAGKSYFDKTCSSCHTRTDAAGMTKKYNAPTLKANILNPAFLNLPRHSGSTACATQKRAPRASGTACCSNVTPLRMCPI